MNTYRVTYAFIVDADDEFDASLEAFQLISSGMEPDIELLVGDEWMAVDLD